MDINDILREAQNLDTEKLTQEEEKPEEMAQPTTEQDQTELENIEEPKGIFETVIDEVGIKSELDHDLIYTSDNPMSLKNPNRVRILIMTDTHLVLKNPTNRFRMIEEGIEIFQDLTLAAKLNNIDAIIHMGDLYDRGYANIPHREYVKQINAMYDLSQAVNENTYMVMGNHSWSFADNNPEFLVTEMQSRDLIEMYRHKDIFECMIPIWKCPAYLDIGSTRINFVHFNPDKKYNVSSDMPYNIGLYHDDFVTFESKQELYHHKYGHGIEVTDTDVFDQMNTAIIGHIHKPLMDFNLNNLLRTDVIVPGSLVNRTTLEKHQYVDLPIIEIDLNSEIIDTERQLPYKIYKYRQPLPRFEESFKTEVVEKNKEMYEYSKIIKRARIESVKNDIFEDYVNTIGNPRVAEFIRMADRIEMLDSEVRFRKYLNKKMGLPENEGIVQTYIDRKDDVQEINDLGEENRGEIR